MHAVPQQSAEDLRPQAKPERPAADEQTDRHTPLVSRAPKRLRDISFLGRDPATAVRSAAIELPRSKRLFQNKPDMLKLPQKTLPMFFSVKQQRKAKACSEATNEEANGLPQAAAPPAELTRRPAVSKRPNFPKSLKEYLSPLPLNSRPRHKNQPSGDRSFAADFQAEALPKPYETSLILDRITLIGLSPKPSRQESLCYHSTIRTDVRLKKYIESPSKANRENRNRTLISHPSQSLASKNPESPYNRMNWFFSTSISHSRQSSAVGTVT